MAVKAQKSPSLLGPDWSWSWSWARVWREGACEASGARLLLLLLPFDIPPPPMLWTVWGSFLPPRLASQHHPLSVV